MLKKKFLIPLATLSLLFSTVACNNNNGKESSQSQAPASSGQAQSSAPAQSSGGQASSAAASSSSAAPAQNPVTLTTEDHVDGRGKDVSWDAQDANKEASDGFTSAGKFTAVGDYVQYTFVVEKAGKVNLWAQVDNRTDSPYKRSDKTGNQSIWYDYYNGRDTGGDWKYKVEVNGAEINQAEQPTYKIGEEDVALKEIMYTDYLDNGKVIAPWLQFNAVQGNNVIRIERNNGYSVNLKKLILRSRDEGALPEPVAPHTVTFATEHAKVLVFADSKDYSKAPTEATTAKTRDSDGYLTGYVAEDTENGITEVKPRVDFQIVLDEGYEFDDGIEKTFTHQEGDPENIKESPEVKAKDISWVTGDFNKAKIIEYTKADNSKIYIYRLTKIKGDLTVNIKAVQPVAQPVGSYHGQVKLIAEAGGAYQPVDMELAADSASILINGQNVPVTSYNWDGLKKVLKLETEGDFGTLTATYDATLNAFTVTGVSGPNAQALDPAVTAVLYGHGQFYNCDGTTAELQNIFQRRYWRPGQESSWQKDNSNADRVTADETNRLGTAGTGVKLRPCGGQNSSTGEKYRVSISLKNDFAEAKAVRALSFWVYNPSANDITLRAWGYQATGYNTNYEFQANTTLTAKANAWTYMNLSYWAKNGEGVAEVQVKNIYNFQVADFTGSGVAFTFENFCLL